MKRLRLNTVFFICLLVIISITFLILFINSIHNYQKIRTITEDKTSKNIKLLTEKIFIGDVKRQALQIDNKFRYTIEKMNLIATAIKEIDRTRLQKSKYNIKLKYNQKSDMFKYLDTKAIAFKNKTKYGFIVASIGNDQNQLETETIKKINNLARVEPLLRSITLNDSSIVLTMIFDKRFILEYGVNPNLNFNLIQNKNKLINPLSSLSSAFKKNRVIFKCVRSVDSFNLPVIIISIPIYSRCREIENLEC
ncbi:MAG TPA: hypothetical protein QF753_04390 [Victivallales bacterium]|nr:hypothetical protein [Victivallales bacterium]